MFLTGVPAKFVANPSVQATCTPQFAGRNGFTATPAVRSTSTHVPSEPTRGQLAPPSASTVMSAAAVMTVPSATRKRLPRSAGPSQRWRVSIVTPSSRRRASHALSRGVARDDRGNTLPLDPTNVGSPRPAHHSRSAAGGNAATASSTTAAPPYRVSRSASGSWWVRLSPLRPASSSLRPTDGMCSYTVTVQPARASVSAAMSPAGPPPTTVAMGGRSPCSIAVILTRQPSA
jgi:hypothetical protein